MEWIKNNYVFCHFSPYRAVQKETKERGKMAGHETREFESCPKNSSLGYQNGLLDTRK